MDVTPFTNASVDLPDYKSGTTSAVPKGDTSVDEGVVSKDTETAIQTEDPVRRAEQAIGAFFEDEATPAGRFTIDKDGDTGRFVYRLINSDTGEVLKQFPGDYVLKRIAYYRDLEGLAVDSKI
ncbi:MAG: flagellar protein FlaG [Sneathiella sp.]|nr:flagellar protein FlaG [Sneathiella sp.]